MNYIADNLQQINHNIIKAAHKSGRNPQDITLVAVTKTISPDQMQQAVDLGVKDIGENRVQELMQKYPEMKGNFHWHLIGHLQTNKIKYIIDKVALIHSVDSLKLVREINLQAKKLQKVQDILIEVNIAGEKSKNGIDPIELKDFLISLKDLSNIKVKGLMTIGPPVENPEENRIYFRSLRNLLVDNNNQTMDNINMNLLSMGMSNDYKIAIEEGANIVRVGRGIFGARI